MKRWFKFWAKYGFAHAIVPEEEYVYMEDEGNKATREAVYEWAADTVDTGYRSFEYGFRRLDKLPDDIREQKIKQYSRSVAYYKELLAAAKDAK